MCLYWVLNIYIVFLSISGLIFDILHDIRGYRIYWPDGVCMCDVNVIVFFDIHDEFLVHASKHIKLILLIFKMWLCILSSVVSASYLVS